MNYNVCVFSWLNFTVFPQPPTALARLKPNQSAIVSHLQVPNEKSKKSLCASQTSQLAEIEATLITCQLILNTALRFKKMCTITHKSQLQTCEMLMAHTCVNIFPHKLFPHRHFGGSSLRDKSRWVCAGLVFSQRSGLNCRRRQLEHIADVSTHVIQSCAGEWRCCPQCLSDLLLFAL